MEVSETEVCFGDAGLCCFAFLFWERTSLLEMVAGGCLDIDTSGVRTATAAVAGTRARARVAAVAVSAGVVRSGGVATVTVTHAVAVEKGNEGSDEEENDVHNGKSPAGLEHRARLVVAEVVAGPNNADITGGNTPVGAAGEADAVGVAHASEEPHTGDKGSDKEKVDEADEKSIGGGAVIAEEREEGPGESENGDDEENKDGVWGEGVLLDEAIDEPG